MALLIVAGALTSGCGEKRTPEDEVRDALRRTAAQPHSFSYVERTGQAELAVHGTVEDDFRYQATLSVDGTSSYEERAVDDVLAARVEDARAISVLGRATQTRSTATTATSAASPSTGPGPSPSEPAAAASALVASAATVKGADDPRARQALATGRWVVDRLGAPSQLPGAQHDRLLGDDPVLDALTVFRHVETAAQQVRVVLFNEDAIDYRPREDPFPQPDRAAHELRYDLLRTDLPHIKQDGKTAERILPTEANFRKMSVYVRDGLVVRVLEDIDVASRLKDLAKIYGIRLPNGADTAALVTAATKQVNAARAAAAQDPIRVRTMALTIRTTGTPPHVELPTDAVVASLALLRNRGSATGDLAPVPTASGAREAAPAASPAGSALAVPIR
jgi:hypothetical protein